MDELRKEELEQMTALLNQYRKELKDFAKAIAPFERKCTIAMLKEHNKQMESSLWKSSRKII